MSKHQDDKERDKARQVTGPTGSTGVSGPTGATGSSEDYGHTQYDPREQPPAEDQPYQDPTAIPG
jgi:hypothetical protein